MSTETFRAPPPTTGAANPDRYSSAGATPDPWDQSARLEYGGDRSFAWTVERQVIAMPPDGREKLEERLLKACALPGRTGAGLAFLCRMLALIGTKKSVPVLAPLARDPRTADSARYALEAISGPEAEAALRDSLGALTGAAKAGLIGSIAARGDVTAVPSLTALKDAANEPAIVREAAGRALEILAHLKA